VASGYQLALNRAEVAEHVLGKPTGRTWGPGTLAVRNGMATLRRHGSGVAVASLPSADYQRHSSVSYTIIGSDGATTWVVRRRGG
jgi:hypothetical protein